ncbi:MAG: 16S rRNA (guanine(966)-N(2))-methyltransferase RsmD [Bryocella sp.]
MFDRADSLVALSSKAMRVIAGTYRSRALQAPKGLATRPTSDRLRETLFNVLATRIVGAKFADLYAGSGAVGIEALSRRAEFCWFAEKEPKATAAIRANLAALKIAGGYALEDRGTQKLLQGLLTKNLPLDIVFLDPPYEAEAEYTTTLRTFANNAATLLAPGAVVIAEHARKQPTAEAYGSLTRYRLLEQGDAVLSFYAITETS